MSDNENRTEQHGCVVCGKNYSMLVVYSPDGKMIDCTPLSPGGHRIKDPHEPLVACDTHTQAEIDAALVRHRNIDQEEEDD